MLIVSLRFFSAVIFLRALKQVFQNSTMLMPKLQNKAAAHYTHYHARLNKFY